MQAKHLDTYIKKQMKKHLESGLLLCQLAKQQY